MLVILGVTPVEVADEKAERVLGRVEVLRQRVDEVPLAEVSVLDTAADRDDALGLQLVAGVHEAVPVLRRRVRVEASLLEEVLVVREPESDRIEADPVLLALEDGELRRVRVLEHVGVDEVVQRVEIAEPDVLHVVDPVEEELDVRHVPGGCSLRELGDDRVRVEEGRLHGRALLLLELGDGVVDPLLDPDGFLLAPPPHLEVAGRRRARARVTGPSALLVVAPTGGDEWGEARCGEASRRVTQKLTS